MPGRAPTEQISKPRNGPFRNSVTTESVGDLATLIPSFERSLGAANKSHKTIAAYGEAANQLLAFLRESGMPTQVTRIGREHLRAS
jgi:hypothetical protein